jgi:hypothetical protein
MDADITRLRSAIAWAEHLGKPQALVCRLWCDYAAALEAQTRRPKYPRPHLAS